VRSRRVIEAGVDHFAVARTDTGPDRRLALDHDDFTSGDRQRPRNRETDDAGADDDAIDSLRGHRCAALAGGLGLSDRLMDNRSTARCDWPAAAAIAASASARSMKRRATRSFAGRGHCRNVSRLVAVPLFQRQPRIAGRRALRVRLSRTGSTNRSSQGRVAILQGR